MVLHRGRPQEVLTSGYPWVAKQKRKLRATQNNVCILQTYIYVILFSGLREHLAQVFRDN